MLSDIRDVDTRVTDMQTSRAGRDQEMNRVRLVRAGRIDELYPEFFADDLPKSVVANIVDVAARDTAELMAPLPALACSSGNMVTASDEQRAAKKNKIGSHYWQKSRLVTQNVQFADSINAYSFGTYIVEPDFECMSPRIRFESPFGGYYYKDRWGELVWYAKVRTETAGTLASMYPEKKSQILTNPKNGQQRSFSDQLKMVTYYDEDIQVTYLPECRHAVLTKASNPLKRVPVIIAERPDVEQTKRGQYDDAIWPALAKSRMAQYMLKAADFSVNAPWAMPDDVSEISVGPDAIIRSQNPQQIQKVRLQIPQDIFALSSELDEQTKEGSRYPEARTGGIKGNIVTGRGVQELMGTMDTQVQTMQSVMGAALEEATSLCFEMDAKLWPSTKKTITGVLTGKPFEISYTPGKDIGDSYACKVTYGFAAGMQPTQALVALLQLRGDNLVSRDTVRRQLPFELDPEEEQRSIDDEQLTDSLKQGFSAFLQAMGPMTMQGMNPVPLLQGAAKAIQLRQKGTPLHEAILEAMQPPEQEQRPEQEPAPQPQPGPPGAPPQGGPPQPGQGQGQGPGQEQPDLPQGVRPNGLPQGVAYGQQGQAPGGMPDIQALMSSLRGQGDPRMEATTLTKKPRV
jgi:hypothetical protein